LKEAAILMELGDPSPDLVGSRSIVPLRHMSALSGLKLNLILGELELAFLDGLALLFEGASLEEIGLLWFTSTAGVSFSFLSFFLLLLLLLLL